MAKPKRDLRSMRQAAMAGDHSAAGALLRLYGFDEIAAEIKRNLPFSPRVRRAVDALTAGTGAPGTIGEWVRRHDNQRRAIPAVTAQSLHTHRSFRRLRGRYARKF